MCSKVVFSVEVNVGAGAWRRVGEQLRQCGARVPRGAAGARAGGVGRLGPREREPAPPRAARAQQHRVPGALRQRHAAARCAHPAHRPSPRQPKPPLPLAHTLPTRLFTIHSLSYINWGPTLESTVVKLYIEIETQVTPYQRAICEPSSRADVDLHCTTISDKSRESFHRAFRTNGR